MTHVTQRKDTTVGAAVILLVTSFVVTALSLFYPALLVVTVLLIPFAVGALRRNARPQVKTMLWVALSVLIIASVFGIAVTVSIVAATV